MTAFIVIPAVAANGHRIVLSRNERSGSVVPSSVYIGRECELNVMLLLLLLLLLHSRSVFSHRHTKSARQQTFRQRSGWEEVIQTDRWTGDGRRPAERKRYQISNYVCVILLYILATLCLLRDPYNRSPKWFGRFESAPAPCSPSTTGPVSSHSLSAQ